MKLTNTAALFLTVFIMASCVSQPVEISEDMTAMQIIQRAQEASDRNRYSVSLQYYVAILERFPYDIDSICAARYEIAFIHYKQKKYDMARAGFNGLLEYYNTPDAELLPQHYRILSDMVLRRIDEIESEKTRPNPS